jgi:hypothetical protein
VDQNVINRRLCFEAQEGRARRSQTQARIKLAFRDKIRRGTLRQLSSLARRLLRSMRSGSWLVSQSARDQYPSIWRVDSVHPKRKRADQWCQQHDELGAEN